MCNVNIVTGELMRYEVDVALVGYIPFEWTRLYKSTSKKLSSVGVGWVTMWDLYIRTDGAEFVFHNEDDVDIPLKKAAKGGQVTNDDGTILLVREGARLLLTRGDGRWYYFASASTRTGVFNLVTILDINGNAVKLEYDDDDHLIALTDTLNRHIRFSYNTLGFLTNIMLQSGEPAEEFSRKVEYSYDSQNNLVAVKDALGRVVRYEYQDHLLVREIGPDGHSFYWCYDDNRRCIRTWREGGILLRSLRFHDVIHRVEVTNSLGYRTIVEYDENKNIVSEVNPLGDKLENVYDETGMFLASTGGNVPTNAVMMFDESKNCLTEIKASGSCYRHFFNDQDLPVRVEDDNGNVWLKEYDEKGQLVHSEAPEAKEWHFEYSPQGYVSNAINPLGHQIYQERSDNRRTIQFSDDIGLLFKKNYDIEGNMIAFTNGANQVTKFDYDVCGRLIRVTSPDGSSSSCQYDHNDNITAITNPLGQSYRYEYDAGGLPIKEINGAGGILRLQYDTEQQLIGITNWKGEKLNITYDALGRPEKAHLFDGTTEQYEYDEYSNLSGVTKANGAQIFYRYSDAGLQTKQCSDGCEKFYNYVSGLLHEAQSSDCQFNQEFDSRLRLTGEGQNDWEVKYSYDAVDNLIKVEDVSGRSTCYEYDARRRLTKIDDSHFGIFQFAYNALDLMIEMRYPNGVSVQRDYDEQDRLTLVCVIAADGKEIERNEYSYDSTDRLVGEVSLSGAQRQSTEYEYDALDRVTEVTRAGKKVEWYRYDENSNIIASSSYDSTEIATGDRILRAGSTHMEYDTCGNLTKKMNQQGQVNYFYNGEDQLIKVEDPHRGITEFAYDGIGRRITKRNNEKKIHYRWSSETIYCEEEEGEIRHYLFLPSSFVCLAMSGSEGNYACVLDQRAAPMMLLDESGATTWARDESLYGQSIPSGITKCPVRFPGQYHDDETGLSYNYHRYYDASLGRYITQDPIGLQGGLNFYTYVTNPLTWIDPYGLFEISVKARCDWNDEQQDAFKKKVKRYNKAINKNKGILIAPCDRKAKNLRREYEKCGSKDGEPKKQSPKKGGKSVDCKDDIDHIVEVQMGGAQEGPELCRNLTPVNASVNRSLGSQLSNKFKGNLGQVLTKVKVEKQDCSGVATRTPSCG